MKEKTRLKEIREKKGISQRELARRINVDNSSISKYEKGVSMTDEVIKKICKALDTNADYFLKLSEDE
ncbi:MAG: helix-turn-helix transcriptional regulator [Candidatus Delongbacteria bacterium]|jgi:repressor LexA|nr:helix-turn-helix transcriptional regulator [Candidatus Delongbacteria bacterium]